MPGSTIGTTLNFGYAGTVSRGPYSLRKVRPVYSGSNSIQFGNVVVSRSDNTFTNADGHTDTLTAANFAGIAVNEIKQGLSYSIGTNSQTGSYSANQPCDVCVEGCVLVNVAYTTGIGAGSAVYVRTVLNGSFPSEVIGSIRAASDSTNTVQLTNACFESGLLDANNMAEIRIKYPNV